jgi:hypothetical protein
MPATPDERKEWRARLDTLLTPRIALLNTPESQPTTAQAAYDSAQQAARAYASAAPPSRKSLHMTPNLVASATAAATAKAATAKGNSGFFGVWRANATSADFSTIIGVVGRSIQHGLHARAATSLGLPMTDELTAPISQYTQAAATTLFDEWLCNAGTAPAAGLNSWTLATFNATYRQPAIMAINIWLDKAAPVATGATPGRSTPQTTCDQMPRIIFSDEEDMTDACDSIEKVPIDIWAIVAAEELLDESDAFAKQGNALALKGW